jgi:hypothetical protein
MKKILPEWDLIQAAQMRMFFTALGVSKDTAEAAIKVRSEKPIEPKREPPPNKRAKR